MNPSQAVHLAINNLFAMNEVLKRLPTTEEGDEELRDKMIAKNEEASGVLKKIRNTKRFELNAILD
jgi:hypothetical protein